LTASLAARGTTLPRDHLAGGGEQVGNLGRLTARPLKFKEN
jgi:hypothetical protein